jgi:L-serine dehydratase
MTVSVFDLFAIGIGPSSSHTVGPMKAARVFVTTLDATQQLPTVQQIKIELFGSLAFTGKGHGTDFAILLGLEGQAPDTINPDIIKPRSQEIIHTQQINLCGKHAVSFHYTTDLIFDFKDSLPFHTNAMRFTAYDNKQQEINSQIFYSIGGGFIVDEEQATQAKTSYDHPVPYPFSTTKELLKHCENNNLDIKEVVRANEASMRSVDEVNARLLKIATVMQECIQKGCESPGILPGGLNVKRRAPELLQKISKKGAPKSHEYTDSMEWLNLYAIAVNEENAAGSRVVTAPTNGAAGVIPAVLHYYLTFYPNSTNEDAVDFIRKAHRFLVLKWVAKVKSALLAQWLLAH